MMSMRRNLGVLVFNYYVKREKIWGTQARGMGVRIGGIVEVM